ncbi:MAG: SGNH/GDSL hydrolase family protein [Bacteroidota bacterium]
MHHLSYIFGAICSIPLLPFLYFQAKAVRKAVPSLPEADVPFGMVNKGAAVSKRLLVIGESTMAGLGVQKHQDGFAGAFATAWADALQVNVNWRVYAKSGFTAKEVREQILPDIFTAKESADLILIGLGGNEAFTLNPTWRWQKESKKLVDALRQHFPDCPILFTNMPPIREFPAFTSLMQFVLGSLVELHGRVLVDTVRSMDNVYAYGRVITVSDWMKRLEIEGDIRDFFSDGVHPSQFTYQVWARDTLQWWNNKQLIIK